MRPLYALSPKGAQLLNEMEEAKGQLEEALSIARGRGPAIDYGPEVEREKWLLAHKLREAIGNLEDVLQSLGKWLE